MVGLSVDDGVEEGKEKVNRFLLRLNSPAILRRKNGMVSPDEKIILDQLERKMNLSELIIEKRF